MCPVGWHELNPSPRAAQIHSPVRRLLCPRDPALHKLAPIYFLQLPPKHTFTCKHNTRQLQGLFCITMRNAIIAHCLLLTKTSKMSTPDFTSLYFHFFKRPSCVIDFWCRAAVQLIFLCFQTPLRERRSLCKLKSCTAARLK